MPEVPGSWPVWTWRHVTDVPAEHHAHTPEHASYWFGEGHRLGVVISWAERDVVIVASEPPSVDAFAHPWLSTIGAWLAHHRGEDSFHGGGFHVGESAWALLGGKYAGKTTTLGWLAHAGLPIAGDDVLIIRGQEALSGPACLDLRAGAAAHFGLAAETEIMPGRWRARVWLPAAQAAAPFRGFIVPCWGEEIAVRTVPPSERIRLLTEHAYAREFSGRELRFLELASSPMLSWTRPKDLARADEAGRALLEAIS